MLVTSPESGLSKPWDSITDTSWAPRTTSELCCYAALWHCFVIAAVSLGQNRKESWSFDHFVPGFRHNFFRYPAEVTWDVVMLACECRWWYSPNIPNRPKPFARSPSRPVRSGQEFSQRLVWRTSPIRQPWPYGDGMGHERFLDGGVKYLAK